MVHLPDECFSLATINYHRGIYVGERSPYNYSFDLLIKQRSIRLSDGPAAVLMWASSPWQKSRVRSRRHIEEHQNELICAISII